MTTISHIMIGATITVVFSIYTILNICTYITDQHKFLVTHYDKKIRSLSEQIDVLSAENIELSSKINNISLTNSVATDNNNNECFELNDVYDEYSGVVEFTNEQLQLLLEVCKSETTICEAKEAKEEEDVDLINVNEEKDDDIVQVPELVDLDDEKDVKRVQDSLLVIARKAILGV